MKNKLKIVWNPIYLPVMIVTVVLLVLSIWGMNRIGQNILVKLSDVGVDVNPLMSGIRMVLILLTSVSILALFLIAWFMSRKTSKPSNQLVKACEILAQKDTRHLINSMNELAQGNMAIHMAFQSRQLPESTVPGFDKLIDRFNQIVQGLHDSASEFNSITGEPCQRLCYVGSDSYLDGRECGKLMGDAIGGKGQVAITIGFFSATNLELRRKGFISIINEKFPDIQIVETVEHHENIDKAISLTKGLIRKYPRLSGIFVTGGATPHAIAQAVVEMKKKGKVKVIGYDLTDKTMSYVKDGVITAVLGQDPFAQGHDPIIHLYNYLVDHVMPPRERLLTQMDVVHQKNYCEFWEEERGIIQTDAALNRLAKPVENLPSKPLYIAVLGREDSDFWIPVKEGVNQAAEKLKDREVRVEWIVPVESNRNKNFTVEAYGPHLQQLKKEGVDGISITINDRNLIPSINQLVEMGIPVVAFNSEPTSIRGLVYSVKEQAAKLRTMSQDIASSIIQLNAMSSKINETMETVAGGVVSQNEQVNNTHSNLDLLIDNIQQISKEAEQSVQASEKSVEAVTSGTEALEKTLNNMHAIEKSVGDSWEIVEELSEHSIRIDKVVELIHDIASRLHVLTLNAAIEAAHAGKMGEGFMVVAGEVKKLALNTTEATEQILQLTGTVQEGIQNVESVMKDGLEMIKDSSKSTDTTRASLEQIRKTVEMEQRLLNNISKALADTQKFSQKVDETMGMVAEVSEKNAQAVDKVNKSNQEIGSHLEDVNTMAQSLKNISQYEQELLAKFKL
ncbi:substrate-binding domain-containing protein [bacterium]